MVIDPAWEGSRDAGDDEAGWPCRRSLFGNDCCLLSAEGEDFHDDDGCRLNFSRGNQGRPEERKIKSVSGSHICTWLLSTGHAGVTMDSFWRFQTEAVARRLTLGHAGSADVALRVGQCWTGIGVPVRGEERKTLLLASFTSTCKAEVAYNLCFSVIDIFSGDLFTPLDGSIILEILTRQLSFVPQAGQFSGKASLWKVSSPENLWSRMRSFVRKSTCYVMS